MKVLAVDPGMKTGIAYYEDGQFDSAQANTYEDAVDMLTSMVWEHKPDVLICEGFDIDRNTHKKDATAYPQTMDLIGACRLLAYQYDIPFLRQSRTCKAFGTNEKLRTLGWWKKNSEGHDHDAARHVLHYLVTQRHIPILQSLTSTS